MSLTITSFRAESTTNANDTYYQVDSNQSAYAKGNYLDTNSDGKLNGGGDNGVSGAESADDLLVADYHGAADLERARRLLLCHFESPGPLPHDQVDSQMVADVLSLGKSGDAMDQPDLDRVGQ